MLPKRSTPVNQTFECQKYVFSHNQIEHFSTYTMYEGTWMLPKRSTPVDQNLVSKSIHSQLSVAIFRASRNLLGAQESLIS